jgi:hypothetical protein
MIEKLGRETHGVLSYAETLEQDSLTPPPRKVNKCAGPAGQLQAVLHRPVETAGVCGSFKQTKIQTAVSVYS